MLSTVVSLLLLGVCLALSTNRPDPKTTEIDCSLYRPFDENTNMYDVFVQGSWQTRKCNHMGMIWDQDLCGCVIPSCPGKRGVVDNPRLYEVEIWGVWRADPESCGVDQIWNQTFCRCDWDPEGPGAVQRRPYVPPPPQKERSCEVMFNATFDKEIKEHQANYFIRPDPANSISVEDTQGAVGGGAARVNDGTMGVWFLAGNDFSDVFQIKLRFKLDDALSGLSKYVTLVSNDCRKHVASVIIQYTPATNSYQVFVRVTDSSVTLNCAASKNSPGFHSVSLEYQNNVLLLKVDGEELCGSDELSGRLAISRCPLSLAGDPLKVNRNIQGYLDEVLLRKYCVV